MEKVSLKMVIINVEFKAWESLKFDFPNKISFFSLYAIQLVFLAILQRRFLLAKCFRLLTVDSNCHSIFSLQQNACDKNWITFISYRLNLCGCMEKKLVCTNKKNCAKKISTEKCMNECIHIRSQSVVLCVCCNVPNCDMVRHSLWTLGYECNTKDRRPPSPSKAHMLTSYFVKRG